MPAPDQIEWDDANAVDLAPHPNSIQWDESKARAVQPDPGASKGLDLTGRVRSALDGITFGFAPRLVSALDKVTGESGDNNAAYAKAVADHPVENVVGALAAPIPGSTERAGMGLAARLGARALPGMVSAGLTSAGHGDSPTEMFLKATGARGLKQAATDASSGNWGNAALDVLGAGGVGSALLGTGAKAIGSGVGAVNRFASRGVDEAVEAAKQIAIKNQDKIEKAAQGSLGGEAQKLNRYLEQIQNLGAHGTADQQAEIQALEGSGRLGEYRQRALGNVLQDLPGQADQVDAKRALVEAIREGRDATIASEADRLSGPGELARQVGDWLKRYLPRAAGGVAGKVLGSAEGPGLVEGQVLGPMVHSLKRGLTGPAMKGTAMRTVQALTAGNPAKLAEVIGAPRAAVLARALREGGDQSFAATHFVMQQTDPHYQSALANLDESAEQHQEH